MKNPAAFVKKFFPPLFAVLAVMSFIIWGKISIKDTVAVQSEAPKTIAVSIGQTHINAFVADTPATLEKGLGGLDSISYGEGMLFVFDRPGRYGIWMKDMKFPIDVFWLDDSRRVVWVVEGMSPDSFPKVFTPDSSARYVIEAAAGFVRQNNVKIGALVSF